MKRFEVVIYTDGSCKGNPGPGGYAAVIKCNGHEKVITGSETVTTNNRMELRALIEATRALKKPCDITVMTDSQYVCTGLANAKEWCNRNWRTRSGAKCANFDMWQELTDLKSKGGHKFHFQHIKGHAGDPENERCDGLARAAITY